MAGIRYIDLVTDAEKITQVDSIRAVVKRLANDVVAHICGIAEWQHLWTTDFFQTIAPVTTGTASITDTDATVTFSSSIITAAMVGRKIRFGSETAYYTIKSRTSATEIELDQNYSGTTNTAATFSLYKDEYLLRADVDVQKRIREAENGIALFSLSATELDSLYPIPTGQGVPSLDIAIGRAVKTYSTGTVSASSGDRTLTGASSPAWLTAEGLTKGTKLQIGTLLFTVNTVDSDTSIEVYEVPTAAIASGTAYVALLNNPVVQLHSIPDSVLTLYYRFQRIPAVMDADNDVPDLPYPMHPLVRLGMLPTLWRHRGNTDRAIADEATFDKQVQEWLAKYNLPVLDRRYPLHPFTLRQKIREARWESGIGVPLIR